MNGSFYRPSQEQIITNRLDGGEIREEAVVPEESGPRSNDRLTTHVLSRRSKESFRAGEPVLGSAPRQLSAHLWGQLTPTEDLPRTTVTPDSASNRHLSVLLRKG